MENKLGSKWNRLSAVSTLKLEVKCIQCLKVKPTDLAASEYDMCTSCYDYALDGFSDYEYISAEARITELLNENNRLYKEINRLKNKNEELKNKNKLDNT